MSRQALRPRQSALKPPAHPMAMAAVHQGIRTQATAELQRKANSSPPVAHLHGVRQQVIQREAVMDYATWKDSSSLKARKRSDHLLAIDEALICYHESLEAPVVRQKERLAELLGAIVAWETVKKTDEGAVKSKRAGKVARLREQVRAKMEAIKKIPNADPQVGSRTDFTHDIYVRVRTRVQNILSVERPRANAGIRRQLVAHLADLREQTRQIDPRHKPVDALWDACSVLIAVAESHLGVRVHTRNHPTPEAALGVYNARFDSSLLAARAQIARHPKTASRISTYLDTAVRDLNIFRSMGGVIDQDMPEMGAGETFDETTGLVAEALDAIGMQGTGGKGNEGLEEYWKSDIDGCDPLAEAKRTVARITGGLHQNPGPNASEQEKAQASSTNDKVSGSADMGAGLVMAVQLGAEIGRYINIANYCKGKPELAARRRWAIAKIILLTTAGTTAAVSKLLGGALTLSRGAGATANSNFFATDSTQGIDMSTDVKLVGDSANVLLSAVDAVKSVVSMVKNIHKRRKKTENYTKSGKEKAEDVVESIGDISGAASAVANSYSAVAKLYYQIAGGGQIAAESASAVAKGTLGPVSIVPLLGVVKGVLDLVRKGIAVAKAVRSRKRITKARDTLAKEGGEGILAALRVTKETYYKRMNRAIIDIIHAAGSIAGGILTTTGLGAGIGGLIGIASAVAKLLQIGVRNVKQHYRNKKGGKLTNLEKKAQAELGGNPGDAFVNQQLRNVRKRRAGGRVRGFDADKSKANKEARYRAAALEILRAPPAHRQVFIKALRLKRGMQEIDNRFDKDGDQAKKVARQIDLIVSAFKER